MGRNTTKTINSEKGGKKIMYFVLVFIGICMIYSYPIISIFIISLFLFCNYLFNKNDKQYVRHNRRLRNIKFGINETSKSEYMDEDIYLGGFKK